jgi:hypothetical protein
MFDAKKWAEDFIQGPKRGLTGEESEVLVAMLHVPESMHEELSTEMSEQLPMFNILKQRAPMIGVEIDPPTMLCMCQISGGNIGNGIMLISAARAALGTKVTLNAFIEQMFPMGVPTDDSYSNAWSAQKIQGGNAVDCREYWV